MKWKIIIFLIVLGMAAADTVWRENTYWFPSQSSSYYILGANFTNLGDINLTDVSFISQGVNWTVHNDCNITLYNWSKNYANFSITGDCNISMCDMNTTNEYDVSQGGNVIWDDINTVGGCLEFNLTNPTETIVELLPEYRCQGNCLTSYSVDSTPKTSSHSDIDLQNVSGNCTVSCMMPMLNSTVPTTERKTWGLCPYGIQNGRNKNFSSDGWRIWNFNYTVDYSRQRCATRFVMDFNSSINTTLILNESKDYSINWYNMPTPKTNVTGLWQSYYYKTKSEDEIA